MLRLADEQVELEALDRSDPIVGAAGLGMTTGFGGWTYFTLANDRQNRLEGTYIKHPIDHFNSLLHPDPKNFLPFGLERR